MPKHGSPRTSITRNISETLRAQATFKKGKWNLQLLELVPNPDTRSANKFVWQQQDAVRIDRGQLWQVEPFFAEHNLEDLSESILNRMSRFEHFVLDRQHGESHPSSPEREE